MVYIIKFKISEGIKESGQTGLKVWKILHNGDLRKGDFSRTAESIADVGK